MISVIFLVTGIILLAVSAIVYVAIGNAGPESVRGLPVGADVETIMRIVQYSVSGLLAALGTIFAISGLVGFKRSADHRALVSRLMVSGVDAEGTVTFVDKNYSILVNNTPIYSIVEYQYRDSSGREHTRRVNRVNSEMVIRKQIQVGTRIAVKYARENPAESIMVF